MHGPALNISSTILALMIFNGTNQCFSVLLAWNHSTADDVSFLFFVKLSHALDQFCLLRSSNSAIIASVDSFVVVHSDRLSQRDVSVLQDSQKKRYPQGKHGFSPGSHSCCLVNWSYTNLRSKIYFLFPHKWILNSVISCQSAHYYYYWQ